MKYNTIESALKIKQALQEYKDAQYEQIKAMEMKARASVLGKTPYTNLPLILKDKALSCNADAGLHLAYSRVFIAAANLVEALEEAGFGENTDE